MLPGEDGALGRLTSTADLFAQNAAVPGEVRLFDHGRPVQGQTLLGDAAAERVVKVAPFGAIGCDDGRQTVFSVPGVAPGVRLTGDSGALPQCDAALRVVCVAYASGAHDPVSLVSAVARGLMPWVGGRPFGSCLVSGTVIGVALGPVPRGHARDAPLEVEIEVASPVQPIVQTQEISVRAICVRALLDGLTIRTHGGLPNKTTDLVIAVTHNDRVADATTDFASHAVVLTADHPACEGHFNGVVGGVVRVRTDRSGRGGATRASAESVVALVQGTARHSLGDQVACLVEGPTQRRLRTRGVGKPAIGGVAVSGDGPVSVLAYHLAEDVVLEADHLAEGVLLHGQAPCRIEAVVKRAAVEIRLGDESARGVVRVVPGASERVRHPGQAQFGVVCVLVTAPVRIDARGENVERTVFIVGHGARR